MQSKDLSSKYPAAKPRIQRASSRRHRSLKNNKSLTILQSNSTVHVNIRKSDSNRTSNDKPVDPIENLLAVRYYLRVLDVFHFYTVFIHSEYSISASSVESIIIPAEFIKKVDR